MTQRKKRVPEPKVADTREINVAKIGLMSAIVVALIGMIGTALTAYFSSQAAQAPILIQIQATQTAETRLALRQPAPPTDTPQSSTFTPTPIPTNTPAPTNTPVPQPPTPTLTICFQDDFSSNNKGWDLDEVKGEHIIMKPEIADGKYRKTATFLQAPWYYWSPKVPGCLPKDFELTVEATIVEASHLEHDEASIIISFRNSRDNSNYYLVDFSNAGYQVNVKKDGELFEVIDWVPSNAFTLEIGRSNSFGVSVKDSLITLSANGQEFPPIPDNTLDQAGTIGLGTGTHSFTQTIVVEFDNLIIKEGGN